MPIAIYKDLIANLMTQIPLTLKVEGVKVVHSNSILWSKLEIYQCKLLESRSSRIILNEKWLFSRFLTKDLQAETYLFRSTGPML